MNDRAVALLEQYDIEVIRTRKGRGAIICDTKEGCLIFKEFSGNIDRLKAQSAFLNYISMQNQVRAENILKNREGELFVKDADGVFYVLKTFCEGREINIGEKDECREAVEYLALMHECTGNYRDETGSMGISLPEKEYEKRNKELKRVRKFLLQRSQKTEFEIRLLNSYESFLEQAYKVTESWENYYKRMDEKTRLQSNVICHGDYKYHNIIYDNEGCFLINFEKCVQDNGIRDLYLFMRKLLEKSGWSVQLGKELMDDYRKNHKIGELEYEDLYHRLSYPEKFWKIVNFYYNSRKAWIPGKNLEKLEKIMKQESAKNQFLEEIFKDKISV